MASGDEIVEDVTGVVNDSNVSFFTSYPYVEGSLRVFINGILVRPYDDDGFYETNPLTGELTLKEAPSAIPIPDIISVRYMEL